MFYWKPHGGRSVLAIRRVNTPSPARTKRYYVICNLPVTLMIQSMNSATLVYTPGSIGLAHPSPWLTMPATYHLFRLFGSLQSNGPPLSPWHVSWPPLKYPAHISPPSMSVLCVHSASIGTSTSRILSAKTSWIIIIYFTMVAWFLKQMIKTETYNWLNQYQLLQLFYFFLIKQSVYGTDNVYKNIVKREYIHTFIIAFSVNTLKIVTKHITRYNL